MAGTLFGMFFGAGNLIFPVHLGQLEGRNVIPAIIGFIVTAVGIPIFGVAAIGSTHSDGLQTLSSKVGKFFHHDKAVYISVMAFTWAAAIFDFMKTLPAGVQSSLHLDRLVAFARQYLPLFDLNLGWLLPACLGFVIGLVIHFSGRKSR